MAVEQRLAYEARVRPRYSVIAGLAGILLLGGAVMQSVGPQPKVDELTIQLIATNKRATLEVVGAVVNGLGLAALAVTLSFLYGAIASRKQEGLPNATRLAGLAGGALAAVGGIAYGTVITIKSHDFVIHGAQTYLQANHLVSSSGLAALQYVGLIGSLLLAIAYVLISLNAMRVGLLTRFTGYLGIVAAAASLLLIGTGPALIIEVFWLLALAYLFSGRWPSGEPPAWRTGRAEPWPSSQELREQRLRKGRGEQPAPSKPTPAAQRETVGVGAERPTRHSASKKRKRKRRR